MSVSSTGKAAAERPPSPPISRLRSPQADLRRDWPTTTGKRPPRSGRSCGRRMRSPCHSSTGERISVEVPDSLQRLIVDCAPSLRTKRVRAIIAESNIAVVPILPSIFDEMATLEFLKCLEAIKSVRKQEKRVLLVANRYRTDLSFPKIISGRIGGAVQPGSEWRQWRQIVGLLDAKAHLSVMPSACALDCNTPHRRKEFAAGASRRR